MILIAVQEMLLLVCVSLRVKFFVGSSQLAGQGSLVLQAGVCLVGPSLLGLLRCLGKLLLAILGILNKVRASHIIIRLFVFSDHVAQRDL